MISNEFFTFISNSKFKDIHTVCVSPFSSFHLNLTKIFNLKRKNAAAQDGFCFEFLIKIWIVAVSSFGVWLSKIDEERVVSDRIQPLIIIINRCQRAKPAWWLCRGWHLVVESIYASATLPLCVHHFFIRLLRRGTKGVLRVLLTRSDFRQKLPARKDDVLGSKKFYFHSFDCHKYYTFYYINNFLNRHMQMAIDGTSGHFATKSVSQKRRQIQSQ